MPSTMLMFDDTKVDLLPSGYDAYAGYVDGDFDNFNAVKAKFPHAHLLSIDVNGTNPSAICLDVEPGDASDAAAVGWVRAKLNARAAMIVVYTSASNVNPLVAALAQAGISRDKYKIWSAHYQAGAHICGPATCGLSAWACDGTQFTNTAFGDSLDESLLLDDFFGTPQPGPAPAYPTLIPGDTGDAVRTLQTRLNAWGYRLLVNGDFNPATESCVKSFQARLKITIDGVVGAQTWAKLLSTPTPPPPAPPSPRPYPAPGHVGEDFSRYPIEWDAVVVNGSPVKTYNVKVAQLNGKVVADATVTGTSTVLTKLTKGWHYKVYVAALGGPPPAQYASFEIIA